MRILCCIWLTFLLTSKAFANENGEAVEGLVSRLFEILEIRHREILRTEESITHNRSEADRRALARILKSKVSDYLRKDSQLESVLNEVGKTDDPEKAFLFRQSMDRLNEYRSDIHQIQRLYFESPLTPSPSLAKPQEGNFENFVASWEMSTPPAQKTRALVSSRDARYFEHVKSQYMSQPEMSRSTARENLEPAQSFENMLGAMSSEINQTRENVQIPARRPLDHYHQTLAKEASSGPRMSKKDGEFAQFHNMLSQVEAGTERTPIAMHSQNQNAGMSLKTAQDMLTVSQVSRPSAVEQLMQDLQAYQKEQAPKTHRTYVPSQGSFNSMLSELEESHAKAELSRMRQTQIAQTPALRNSFQTARQLPVATPLGGVDQKGFETFRTTMEAPTPGVHLEAGGNREVRSGQSFAAFISDVPEEPLPDMHGSPQNSTNRFEVILSDLIRANRGHDSAPLPTDSLETELKLVFTDPSAPSTSSETRPEAVAATPQFLPDFDLFPGAVNESLKRAPASAQVIGGLQEPLALSSASSRGTSPASGVDAQTAPAQDLMAEGPLASSSDEMLVKASERLALKARARLLRTGASLIPVRIEARDVKDRLYADLPVDFEILIKPDDSIAAEIIDASPHTPLQRTVLTDARGVAQIHLLLDLENKEADISRELIVNKDSTICRVTVTPRFQSKD